MAIGRYKVPKNNSNHNANKPTSWVNSLILSRFEIENVYVLQGTYSSSQKALEFKNLLCSAKFLRGLAAEVLIGPPILFHIEKVHVLCIKDGVLVLSIG